MSEFARFKENGPIHCETFDAGSDHFTPTLLEKYGGAALKALGVSAVVLAAVASPAGIPVLLPLALHWSISGPLAAAGAYSYIYGAGLQAGANRNELGEYGDLTRAGREQRATRSKEIDRRFLKSLMNPLS